MLIASGDAGAVAADVPADPAPVAAATLGASPPAGSLFLFPERLPLADGGLTAVDRGWIFVPVDRSDPGASVLSVEVYRFPALESADPSTPPIFLLRGGPGFRGLEGEIAADDDFYDERVRPFVEIADLVVVGQRGIGSSKPDTRCESAGGLFGLAACKSFWEGTGLELSGLNVVEAAADVRDVALALGYERITIQGHSFGSHWGMAVLRNHPEIVSRAVLSGLEGPDHTYDSPTGVLNALKRMAAAAEASPRLAGHIPEGGLIAALAETIERARTERLTVSVEDPRTGRSREVSFGASDVRRMAMGYTARINSRRGMPSWPADVLALHAGDYARAARTRVPSGDRGEDGGDASGPRRERYRTASYFMLDCSSGVSAARAEALEDDPARAIVGDLSMSYRMSCPVWKADLGDDFRENFDTHIPALLVHGTWDVNTPYDNALELAPHFKRGKLVPVIGGSHNALHEAREHSDAFREALATFLRTGDLAEMPDEVELPPIDWEIPTTAEE